MNFLDKKIQTKGEFVVKEVDGEYIIVPLQNNVANMNMVYTLNELGYFIWRRLDGRRTVRIISEEIADEFDVELNIAERDTKNFLNEIKELLTAF